MSAQHTQGRLIAREWSFHSKTTLGYIGPDGHFVAIGDVGGHGRHSEEDEPDARRLVACWNACLDFPTDDLESCPDGGLFHLAAHANELAIQRDELLALLEYAHQWIDLSPHGDNCFVSDHYEGDPGNRCNCGKESIVVHMEEVLAKHQPTTAGEGPATPT